MRVTTPVARSYVYQISRRKTAFFKPYVWWIKDPLDAARMREAAQRVRRHAATSPRSPPTSPARNPTKVLVDRLEIVEDGDLVLVRILGSHFLWRMVRRIVGVLAAVGRGEMSPADAARFLDERSDIPATLTAPASGLFLEGVYYRGGRGTGPLRGDPPASGARPIRPAICGRFTIGTNRTAHRRQQSRARLPCLREDAQFLIPDADRHDDDPVRP